MNCGTRCQHVSGHRIDINDGNAEIIILELATLVLTFGWLSLIFRSLFRHVHVHSTFVTSNKRSRYGDIIQVTMCSACGLHPLEFAVLELACQGATPCNRWLLFRTRRISNQRTHQYRVRLSTNSDTTQHLTSKLQAGSSCQRKRR